MNTKSTARNPFRALLGATAAALLFASCGSGGPVAIPTTAGGNQTATLPTYMGDPAKDPVIGMAAPALTGPSLYDSKVVIDEKPGNTPMVVVFAAHWCPHCNKELPGISQWLKDGKLPAGMRFVLVSSDPMSNAPNYPPSQWLVAGMKFPTDKYPVIDDTAAKMLQTWGVAGFPMFYAVNAQGKITMRSSGEIGIAGFEKIVAAAQTA